jgi:hypothetical protein
VILVPRHRSIVTPQQAAALDALCPPRRERAPMHALRFAYQQGQVGRTKKGAAGGSDPYAAFVVLNMSAVDDDTSSFNHTVTPVGSPVTDTSDFGFAPSSCSYPTTSDRSVVTESADLRLGTADFIAEVIAKPDSGNTALGGFYVKGTNTSDGILLAMRTGGLTFRADGTSDLSHSVSIGSSSYVYAAFIGEGGTLRRIYYASTPGGTATQVASGSLNYNNTDTGDAAVGNGGSNGFFFTGRLHLRISKGTTRGITGGASFTSPTSF